MKDLRTSLVEAIAERLARGEANQAGHDSVGFANHHKEAAEIAADVVLERLEEIGVYDNEPLYRWREPNREDGTLSPSR